MRKLRLEVTEKDGKIKELNKVIGQLQGKLQDKINELKKESADKNRFKDLYHKYQDKVVQLEEGTAALDKESSRERRDSKKSHSDKSSRKSSKSSDKKKNQKMIPKVDPKQLIDVC